MGLGVVVLVLHRLLMTTPGVALRLHRRARSLSSPLEAALSLRLLSTLRLVGAVATNVPLLAAGPARATVSAALDVSCGMVIVVAMSAAAIVTTTTTAPSAQCTAMSTLLSATPALIVRP